MSRESIYNVNSEIRLEDYNENETQKWDSLFYFKRISFVILAFLSIYLLYSFTSNLFKTHTKLAIANEYLDENNISKFYKLQNQILDSSKPIHIRFEWGYSGVDSEYLKINVFKINKGVKTEEASMGRRKPHNARYIYFMGPLESGNYSIEIIDQRQKILQKKEIKIQ